MRFSVRGLMTLVVILGGALGWVVHLAHIQRDAVAEIERAGGGVMYNWQYVNGLRDDAGKPPWPKWLVDLVGVDYLGSAVHAVFCGEECRDELLAGIGSLSRLDRLNLDGAGVSGAGFVHLERLGRLQILELGGSDVGDADLRHLAGLTSLKQLYLNATKIGDAGVAHLEGLRGLEWLYLAGTQVSDVGLIHLRGLGRLQVLNLINTRVSDAGLEHLKTLPDLQYLYLGGTQVTDAGLKHLEAMTSLRVLDLNNDEAPPPKVTRAAAKELQHALPNLTIEF
ncbi:MAG: hypothetical protein P4L85_21760 [Paludisphaera borealis]|uniref:leucine-rich repeat domain-containing protein n=1 Tax=Paludisphaera borealis TaxID=1387353 RepID=UPI0028487EA7|nr:hypothetical protein [Paludisphaera borealis]MDR3621992.1 hypothetical protein [Paludisphaera borealis]